MGGNLNEKDLNLSINWEAKKVIPLPLEDIVLDWQKIDEPDLAAPKPGQSQDNQTAPAPAAASFGSKKPTMNRVLLIGAPKNLIKSYAYTFKSLRLNLISLETEVFGLIRSLVGSDKATIMIIQMGASSSNIFIVDKGIPLLSRSIDVGGLAITKAISRNLNISLEKAEQFKYDLTSHGQADLPKPIIEAMTPVVNEAKYILSAFSSKEKHEIERVILSGGSSLLQGLPEYFSAMLEKNVVVGDPWFRVAYPVELKPVLEQIGPRMSVAIGLAMREFDKK